MSPRASDARACASSRAELSTSLPSCISAGACSTASRSQPSIPTWAKASDCAERSAPKRYPGSAAAPLSGCAATDIPNTSAHTTRAALTAGKDERTAGSPPTLCGHRRNLPRLKRNNPRTQSSLFAMPPTHHMDIDFSRTALSTLLRVDIDRMRGFFGQSMLRLTTIPGFATEPLQRAASHRHLIAWHTLATASGDRKVKAGAAKCEAPAQIF